MMPACSGGKWVQFHYCKFDSIGSISKKRQFLFNRMASWSERIPKLECIIVQRKTKHLPAVSWRYFQTSFWMLSERFQFTMPIEQSNNRTNQIEMNAQSLDRIVQNLQMETFLGLLCKGIKTSLFIFFFKPTKRAKFKAHFCEKFFRNQLVKISSGSLSGCLSSDWVMGLGNGQFGQPAKSPIYGGQL